MCSRQITTTVECFVRKEDRYLMLRRHPNKRILPNVWIAPGGHRELVEGLIHCTRREIKEETGLDIKNVRIRVCGIALLQDLNEEFIFHILTADYAGGDLISSREDGELVWLTAAEIMGLDNILAELRPVLPRILNDSDLGILSVRAVYGKVNELLEFEIEDPS